MNNAGWIEDLFLSLSFEGWMRDVHVKWMHEKVNSFCCDSDSDFYAYT